MNIIEIASAFGLVHWSMLGIWITFVMFAVPYLAYGIPFYDWRSLLSVWAILLCVTALALFAIFLLFTLFVLSSI